MKYLAALLFLISISVSAANAQGEWCGYALIQGLPMLDSDLSVLAALTPGYDPYSSQPDTLFQRRWNMDRSAVIIEGCFSIMPSRELIISIFDGVLEQTYEEIDLMLGYTLFTPELDRDQAAYVVRQYILGDRAAWGEE